MYYMEQVRFQVS